MNKLLAAASALALATTPLAQAGGHGDDKFPATLAGHALVPAASVVDAPADAAPYFDISGRWTQGASRVDEIGAITGYTFGWMADNRRPTGYTLPMQGQPLQGFSGIIKGDTDGGYWVTSDNGFGSRANSADALLMFHHVTPDWATGAVAVDKTVFMQDPNGVIPFRLTAETAARHLTGADFDIESIQRVGDDFYFGDEFGPYLIRTDAAGVVTGFWETQLNGNLVKAPQHHTLRLPRNPNADLPAFTVKQSRGFEGMALADDGTLLVGMLEGPVWDPETNAYQEIDGTAVLPMPLFDTTTGTWTGGSFYYPLEAPGNAIGDFNMIDATTALVIERDWGEGAPSGACADGQTPAADNCFAPAALFKRVYKISFDGVSDGEMVRKVGYVDLLDINDPNGVARQGGEDGKFTFPFITIENVIAVDDQHILVGNDNNYPFSAGRFLDKNDDNEFILLAVPELMDAQ